MGSAADSRGLAALERANARRRERARTRCRPRLPRVTRARSRPTTPTGGIAALYEGSRGRPSPIVELNRAVAVAMALGPRPGSDPWTAAREPSLGVSPAPELSAATCWTNSGRHPRRVGIRARRALTRNGRERAVLAPTAPVRDSRR